MKGIILNIIAKNIDVKVNNTIFNCVFKGSLKHNNIYPVIGDFVHLVKINDQYVIDNIYSRKNLLIRPSVSNIDYVIIVQSVIEPDLNTYILNKYLAHYEYYVKNVIICFTKIDLLDTNQYNAFMNIANQYINDKYLVLFSNNQDHIKHLQQLVCNQTICFIGNSGVGKSTLLNKIDPNLKLKTQEISKALNRGKHTTVNIILIPYNNGYFIDTPGFSSLNLNLNKLELAKSYHDFYNNYSKCKFKNCLHISEPDCKIQQLVSSNKISKMRYNDYLKIQNELNKKKLI